VQPNLSAAQSPNYGPSADDLRTAAPLRQTSGNQLAVEPHSAASAAGVAGQRSIGEAPESAWESFVEKFTQAQTQRPPLGPQLSQPQPSRPQPQQPPRRPYFLQPPGPQQLALPPRPQQLAIPPHLAQPPGLQQVTPPPSLSQPSGPQQLSRTPRLSEAAPATSPQATNLLMDGDESDFERYVLQQGWLSNGQLDDPLEPADAAPPGRLRQDRELQAVPSPRRGLPHLPADLACAYRLEIYGRTLELHSTAGEGFCFAGHLGGMGPLTLNFSEGGWQQLRWERGALIDCLPANVAQLAASLGFRMDMPRDLLVTDLTEGGTAIFSPSLGLRPPRLLVAVDNQLADFIEGNSFSL
jgi:hypothetical protein